MELEKLAQARDKIRKIIIPELESIYDCISISSKDVHSESMVNMLLRSNLYSSLIQASAALDDLEYKIEQIESKE